jgi:adenine C2-methylase RlmN of 23S rRNA A2503 and tRNA A37
MLIIGSYVRMGRVRQNNVALAKVHLIILDMIVRSTENFKKLSTVDTVMLRSTRLIPRNYWPSKTYVKKKNVKQKQYTRAREY